MKRVLGSLGLLLFAAAASAQMPNSPPPAYYLIHEEVARPSMVAQYESTTRDLLNAFTEKKADPKVFGMTLYSTPDLHYIYVVPIANWAALDTFQQAWTTIGQQIGKDRWTDLMKRGNGAMESYTEYVVVRRNDLSYQPETPRVKIEDRRYAHWTFYYIDAAHVEEAEQVAKDVAALYKSKNIDTPFVIYQAVSGHDLPLYIVGSSGKSAADYWLNDDRVASMIGNEMRPLEMRALSFTRKLEVREARRRPELSYPMPAPVSSTK